MPPENAVLADLLDLHEALPTAWLAASSAGAFLRDQRPRALAVDTKTTPTDAVSMMDRTAEQMIVQTVLDRYPLDGFLGEEGGERPSRSGRRWVVDPLDGTVNYLYGIPEWGVSIALDDDAGTAIGVVCLPALGESYVAVRGRGAWKVVGETTARLAGSACTDLAQGMVGTGFGYAASRRTRQAQVLAEVIGQVRDVRRTGCAVVDLAWTAQGRLDAFYEYGLNPWDYSAGALICREAGVRVTGLRDDAVEPLLLAAAPAIAGDLAALLASLAADDMP